jgi:hypothetical protein
MRELCEFWNASSERRKDSLCLAAVVLFCLILFGKTVFFGQSISRVYELAGIDYLFGQVVKFPTTYDLHCFFMKMAGYMLVAGAWREGTLPLWNPYIGCGAPLLAELQSIVLSPWMLFYTLWPSQPMHNYLLVAQEVLGAVGMFLAARALGLSRYAAIFAAFIHLCCPHQQWRTELQMNHSFYPITVWCFIRLYQTKNFLWALAAGAGCAAQIVSGDAQVSLLSITCVCFLFASMNLLGDARKDSIVTRVRDLSIWLAVAGANAFCLASPVFLSFIELVRIGDLSKKHAFYAFGNPAPWESLVYCLLHPGYGGASLYAGCLTVPLLCLSLLAIKQRRPYYLSVLVTAVFAFLSASRTGPFPLLDPLLGLSGLSRFEGMEVYLVQIAFLMAFGLETLVNNKLTVKSWVFAVTSLSCIAVIALPAMLSKAGFNPEKYTFDPHVDSYGFQSQQWTLDVFILSAFLVLILIRATRNMSPLLLILVPICLNTGSEVFACQKALPNPPRFRYPKWEVFSFLAEKKERIVPVGYNLLHPNVNMVYRIPSLAYEGPLSPPRLHEFVRAAGSHADAFNKLFPDGPFKKLLNLASVRYFISFTPVRNADEPYTQHSAVVPPVRFKGDDKVRVDAAQVHYDEMKGEFGGYVEFYVKENEGEKYIFQLVVYDDSGKVYWTGGPYYTRQREYFKLDTRPKTFSRVPLSGIIPDIVPESSKFSIGLEVKRVEEQSALFPENASVLRNTKTFKVAEFTKRTLPLEPGRRFKVVKELPGSFIRIYENLQAMPAAFVVHKTLLIEGEKDVLNEISKESFDPSKAAVIEDKNVPALNGEDAKTETDEVKFVRTDLNTISIDVKTDTPAFLVVTDQHFPGWHAVVDGAEVPIARANYLFKGISIAPGSHKVFFYFRPTYLSASLGLFGACISLNAVAWYVLLGRRRKSMSGVDSAPS